MYSIYLDNFRGFQDDIVPVTTVSFLVGENSSGKTSFLAALDLLSSFEFWVDPSFTSQAINLGSFNDIVSLNSQDRSYFTLGWFFSHEGKEDSTSVFNAVTFREVDSKPKLFRYSFLYGDQIARVQYNHDRIGYRLDPLDVKERNFNELFDVFCKTAQTNKTRLKRLTYLKNGSDHFPDRSPYFGPMTFLEGFKSKDEGISVLSPVMFGNSSTKSIAPIRTQPKRVYDSVEIDPDNLGSGTPYILRRELAKQGQQNKLQSGLQSFGTQSGLFVDVKVHTFGRGDESPSGSGAPFEVGIVLDQQPINLPFVGYGVSQVLPIAVDVILGKEDEKFIIQQPEVHLHPKAQAAFGDLLFTFASTEDKSFFVETHSDFLINRFRLAMSREKRSSRLPLSSVVFFERDRGFNRTSLILIHPSGKYDDDQPSSFREFFLSEKMELLDI